MSTVVAIAGKGGTGKTTVAALLIRYLKQNGRTPVLAVDADADSNLPQALGIAGEKTSSAAKKVLGYYLTGDPGQ